MASSTAFKPDNAAAAAAAATTSTTATSNPSSSCYYPTPIPVRVDVTSDDKSVRIIDTLLIDPTCWPITLYTPLRQAVEANVREYAYTLLSDTEVQGMGRTVRHFTGRVDLYTPQLQTKIEDQLRPQLLAIAFGNNVPKPKQDSLTKINIRLIVHGGIEIHEDLYWDCSVPYSPFDFAKNMVEEWNLPEQAIVPIATTILEQLYYDDMKMDTSPDLLLQASNESAASVAASEAANTSDTVANSYGSSTTTKAEENTSTSRRGAWKIEHKENLSLMGQLVSHHRVVE